MLSPREYRFNSSAIGWCRYYPDTRALDMADTSGSAYRYHDVPPHVVDALVVSPSVGKFFHKYISHTYPCSSVNDASPLLRTSGSTTQLVERSMSAISTFIPDNFTGSIADLLSHLPILVIVVNRRKTKHGDHSVSHTRGYSKITINHSGNQFRFVITLLHEITHAIITHKAAAKVDPHGPEWKMAFGELLTTRLPLFPEELHDSIRRYARNPLYSTDSDTRLSTMLRKYDTLDLRPTVAELPIGQMFSLNGRDTMVKGRLMRKSYLCTTSEGKRFRVSPVARVHTIYTQELA
ncbi:MAG: KTSC domain-containing protein [Lentisphaerae bacterium]|nr:KTSC domain-containing protein [Lentisphaerota bacterium]